VSGGGGAFAVWSKRTRELFFRQGDAVMAVAVPSDSASQFGRPTMVFTRTSRPQFDTTPEGEFVMIEDPPGTPAMSIQVAINWFNALSVRR
jgi:hypothetical protein